MINNIVFLDVYFDKDYDYFENVNLQEFKDDLKREIENGLVDREMNFFF